MSRPRQWFLVTNIIRVLAGHTAECIRRTDDCLAWDARWSAACSKCDAAGVLTWEESRPWGSTTAMETMSDACTCTCGLDTTGERPMCPRCRAAQAIGIDEFHDKEPACVACGWEWGRKADDLRPRHVCDCEILREEGLRMAIGEIDDNRIPTPEDIQEARRLMDRYSKRCPKCKSPNATSLGGVDGLPLRHRCIECHHEFADFEALPSVAREESDRNIAGSQT